MGNFVLKGITDGSSGDCKEITKGFYLENLNRKP